MAIDWENFLDPYIQAVGELKIKLRGIRKQYRKQQKHSPIEFVTGRVKPIESIREKMIRRNISEENLAQDMQDIAGLRIMVVRFVCFFLERPASPWGSKSRFLFYKFGICFADITRRAVTLNAI